MINTVIFDLGGVLIDWNPRHLYKKIFDDGGEMEWFLKEVCSGDWNVQQDAGRPFEVAVEELSAEHPKYRKEIEAYYSRWSEMLGGPIDSTVETSKRTKA